MLHQFRINECKPVSKLANSDIKPAWASLEDVCNQKEYLSTRTRPDIAFAVGIVACFCANPSQKHWRILRYLKGTVSLGLVYKGNGSTECTGYSDADWAGDIADRESTSGYLFIFGGAISLQEQQTDLCCPTHRRVCFPVCSRLRSGVAATTH